MKKKAILIILLSLAALNYARNITGKWRINPLLGMTVENEYLLTAMDMGKPFVCGNNLTLKPDGTFISQYTAPCGNDCFTSNFGTYEMVGENHIRFFLRRVMIHGDCKDLDTMPDKDLGLYHIYGDSATVKLIKSDGKAENDLKNVRYSALIDSFDKETRHISNLYFLSWKKANSETVPEMVRECLLRDTILKADDANILFSKKIRGAAFMLVLMEVNGKYYYMVCDWWRKNTALYNRANLPK